MAELAAFFTADHRACDQHWAEVEAAADAGDADGAVAGFETFDSALRRHVTWEEEVLFPAFEDATGMVDGPTVVMRAEHDQMRGMLAQMRVAASNRDVELLADHGDTLLMLIQQHNSKEEQVLYPMAERALGSRWAELEGLLR